MTDTYQRPHGVEEAERLRAERERISREYVARDLQPPTPAEFARAAELTGECAGIMDEAALTAFEAAIVDSVQRKIDAALVARARRSLGFHALPIVGAPSGLSVEQYNEAVAQYPQNTPPRAA